jgi:hypothetical protein
MDIIQSELASSDPLMQPILWNGKEYRTSHYLHRVYLANSPHRGKYRKHGDFIRKIKNLETYQIYIETGDLVVLPSYKEAIERIANIATLNDNNNLRASFQAIGWQILYLVNETIQVAMCHHLDDEENKRLSVAANTKTARELTGKSTLPTELAHRTLQAMLAIGKLFGTPEHIALEQGVKQALLDTGVDLQPFMIAAPAMDDITDDDVMLEPTDLANKLQLRDGAWVNRFLAHIGWQQKGSGQDTWQPTQAGQKYASRHAWMRNGKSGYNWKWNVHAVRNELQRRNMLVPSAVAD